MLCLTASSSKLTARGYVHNVIKDPQWYAVQESDTTMLPNAAALFEQ